jgi:hypothetical protein
MGSDEIVNDELVFTQIFDHNAVNFQRIPMCIPKRRALQARHFDISRVEIDSKMVELPSKVGFSIAWRHRCVAEWTCCASIYPRPVRAYRARHLDISHVEIDPKMAELPSKNGFSDAWKLRCIAEWPCSTSVYPRPVRTQRARHFGR